MFIGKFTLKDLIVDYDAPSFHQAFKIEERRGKEIVSEIEKEIVSLKNWDASMVLRKLAEKGTARNEREVAFVTLLVGCHVGERMLLTNLKEKAEFSLAAMMKKKESKYVN